MLWVLVSQDTLVSSGLRHSPYKCIPWGRPLSYNPAMVTLFCVSYMVHSWKWLQWIYVFTMKNGLPGTSRLLLTRLSSKKWFRSNDPMFNEHKECLVIFSNVGKSKFLRKIRLLVSFILLTIFQNSVIWEFPALCVCVQHGWKGRALNGTLLF